MTITTHARRGECPVLNFFSLVNGRVYMTIYKYINYVPVWRMQNSVELFRSIRPLCLYIRII